VRETGRRWAVEEDFHAGKGLAALGEHQVRRWISWYRWATLAMFACDFLTVAAACEHAEPPTVHEHNDLLLEYSVYQADAIRL